MLWGNASWAEIFEGISDNTDITNILIYSIFIAKKSNYLSFFLRDKIYFQF